jgi:ribosomal protein S12 methylthiotransferase
VIRENPKVCAYVDIPLQHIADPVLKSMRRGTTMEKTNRLLDAMRTKVPGMAIRTTLIVGYPGETEDDFQTLLDWVIAQRFDRLGVFTYSHEENTHAFGLEDDVPAEVKQARLDAIMEAQMTISEELNAQKVGQRLVCIIDRVESDGTYVGRTEHDSPDVDNEVHIHAPEVHLKKGTFVEVEITSASEYDLEAILV